MATKEKVTRRSITGNDAIQITKYANKLLHYNLASVEHRKKYFEAIRTLRELSDIYCEISGIDLV